LTGTPASDAVETVPLLELDDEDDELLEDELELEELLLDDDELELDDEDDELLFGISQ
jgi:hypothetical protein